MDTEVKKAIKEGLSPDGELPFELQGKELPCSLMMASLALKDDLYLRWSMGQIPMTSPDGQDQH